MKTGLRVAWGAACLALSLLCVFRAPTYDLWLAALVVTENGHVLALLSLLTFLPGFRESSFNRFGAAAGFTAAVLSLTPIFRAETVASSLPSALEASFGPTSPKPPFLQAPFSLLTQLRGVKTGPVREDAILYSRSCGGLSLQLFRPVGEHGASPLVVQVHGGSWRSGDRFELTDLARYLAARGYAVASIDYALAPETTFPGPVDDVREAIRYLRAHAAELGLDAKRVALLGRSAGAQIALAAAHAKEPIPGIAGVVDFYGPNDLYLAWAEPGSILPSRLLLRQYLGGSPAEFPERYDEASPLLAAGPKTPPILMVHGSRDELVWPVHQLRLSAKLKAAGVPHYYLALPWATHGCDYFLSGPCGQLSTYAVERFLAAAFATK